MEVLNEIIGNIHDEKWHKLLHEASAVETIYLDQWTAQKSRFLAKSDLGNEYPVALKRQSQIADGDVLKYDPETKQMLVLRLNLNSVMVFDLSQVTSKPLDDIVRICVELGHAIGNQHWPAVVKGTKVYVPLTVDKKVMQAVMDTHNLENITYCFQDGQEVIPYMAPHEVRRLFGGASHGNEHIHTHDHGHIVH